MAVQRAGRVAEGLDDGEVVESLEREVAAGAMAGDMDAAGIDTEAIGVAPAPGTGVVLAVEFGGRQAGSIAVTSISTLAPSSTKPATCSAVIAGKWRPISSR